MSIKFYSVKNFLKENKIGVPEEWDYKESDCFENS